MAGEQAQTTRVSRLGAKVESAIRTANERQETLAGLVQQGEIHSSDLRSLDYELLDPVPTRCGSRCEHRRVVIDWSECPAVCLSPDCFHRLQDEDLHSRQLELRRGQARKQLEAAGYSGDMFKRTYDVFRPVHPLQVEALKITRMFTQRVPDLGKGLILWGNGGVGKTHLLLAGGQSIMADREDRLTLAYICGSELENMDRRSIRDLAALCESVDVVLFDEIDKALVGAPVQVKDFTQGLFEHIGRTGHPKIFGTSEVPLRPRPAPADETEKDKTVREASCLSKHLKPHVINRAGKIAFWQEVDGSNGHLEEPEPQERWWLNGQ